MRRRVRARMRGLPPLLRAQQEELVNAAVMAMPAWSSARTVLLYREKAPELSVTSLGNAAFRDGKRVLFPRVERGGLSLREVGAWTDLEPGAYGIDAPRADAPAVEPSDVDLAVVPGVAFTSAGDRLGQGGGFYDRLLPALGGQSVGVGFDCQLLECVPVEPHDVPVGAVVVPSSLL